MATELKNSEKQIGTVEGTGAAINVSIGFTPRKVKLWNIDDVGTLNPFLEWCDGMGAGKGVLFLNNAYPDMLSTGGITQYAGSAASAGLGFTIGTNANINVSGETIVYEADK